MVAFASPLRGKPASSQPSCRTVIGARAVTPLIYSIHFGALMTLSGCAGYGDFTAVCVVTPISPVASPARPLLLLQVVLGLGAAIVWLAAKAAIHERPQASPRQISRFFFFSTAGNVLGPPLLG